MKKNWVVLKFIWIIFTQQNSCNDNFVSVLKSSFFLKGRFRSVIVMQDWFVFQALRSQLPAKPRKVIIMFFFSFCLVRLIYIKKFERIQSDVLTSISSWSNIQSVVFPKFTLFNYWLLFLNPLWKYTIWVLC